MANNEINIYALDLGNQTNFVGDVPAEASFRTDAMGNPIMPNVTHESIPGISTGPEGIELKPKIERVIVPDPILPI